MPYDLDLLRQVLETFSDPSFIIDGDTLLYANRSFLSFFETANVDTYQKRYDTVAAIFKDPSSLRSAGSWSDLQKHNDLILMNDNGDEMPISLFAINVDTEHDVIITHDLTEHHTHTKQLQHIYFTDELTSLPNRAKLLKDIDGQDPSEHMALAVFDMDAFKEINDFYGHLIGDYIIHAVSQRIKEFLISEDMLFYRLPADSFALLILHNIEQDYFKTIVLFIIDLIRDHPFIYYEENEKLEIDVAVTAGISFGTTDPLSRADIALYEAKSRHANLMIYDDSIKQGDEFRSNLHWIRMTKEALNNDLITPYFQPIVDNSTGKIVKYECLARLIGPDGKATRPEFFLEIAKRTKIYPSITKVIIKKSFQHFSRLPYEFSINLSIEDVHEHNILKYIRKMLLLYPVAERVVFEILETEEIDDYSQISAFTKQVKSLGCKVAIDDFGSGYSNFSHLVNLDFDYLKIDASLIQDIHINSEKQAVLKSIIAFVQAINKKTVAEFVESEMIFKYVKEAGVDFSQGFYFGRPAADTLKAENG